MLTETAAEIGCIIENVAVQEVESWKVIDIKAGDLGVVLERGMFILRSRFWKILLPMFLILDPEVEKAGARPEIGKRN